MKINKLKKQRIKGFTLVELLVSLSIFILMSVIMSNIVISMSRFSLLTERRTDILTELDNISNIIKNDLRGAKEIGICPTSRRIYRVDQDEKAFSLNISSANNINSISWLQVESGANCSNIVKMGESKSLSSRNLINIYKMDTSYAIDSTTKTDPNLNSIVYINLEICDVFTTNKIFDCKLDNNNHPITSYVYVFSITTRKLNVI